MAPRNRHEPRDDRADVGHYPPNKIQQHLKGVSYPAGKNDLVSKAKQNQAPDIVMEVLNRLPEKEYGGPQEVMKATKPLI